MRKTIDRLQEFSLPLIAGVILAMVWANMDSASYQRMVHTPVYAMGSIFNGAESADLHHSDWDHYLTLHFLINDIFMALFFGIAAKEIAEACLPNGALNPPSKAINPLFGTVGGVVGPICVFLGLNALFGRAEWQNGWGVPTATDIALAWLVIRFMFGARHPAVSFLLLLAVADDAIGLGIIAVGYPDPAHPTQWLNLWWCLLGMGTAYALRRAQVMWWMPYIAVAGVLCWWGLYSAHLHPALALVFVVPFLPGPRQDMGLFVDDESDHAHDSPLEQFEHQMKLLVDFGLFFFALVNAGVAFGEINGLSWLILTSLIVGKVVGIVGFSLLAQKLGFQLPTGMNVGHLIVSSCVAGLGLTVALFVSGQAFVDPSLQGAAKMGAVFSVAAALVAVIAKVILGVTSELDTGETATSVAKSEVPQGAAPKIANSVVSSTKAETPSDENSSVRTVL